MNFLSDLWYTFTCWITWLGNMIYYVVVEGIEFIFDAFFFVLAGILALLPTFELDEPQLDGTAVGWLNYFIPLTALLAGFSAIMTCWILYRLYVFVLRWGKVADDS